jgi:hypothetical protein
LDFGNASLISRTQSEADQGRGDTAPMMEEVAKSGRRSWLRTDVVARVVGPVIGGMLLLGSLLPSPGIGAILGAMVGAIAGLRYNHELARSR